jgi:ParB-like chromosome segregation protein Spo0J
MDQNQTGLAAGNGKAGEERSSNSSEQSSNSKATGGVQAPFEFHPLADIFPLMEGAEFDELVADIKANGLHEDIVLYKGKILDGRNRYRACLAAGVPPLTYNADSFITDPAAYVVSANVHRRHLTVDQRCALIKTVLAAAPEKSDRQVAKIVRLSHPKVAAQRRKLEAAGDVVKISTSKDTKGRKQPRVRRQKPASKSRKPQESKQSAIAEMIAGRAAVTNAKPPAVPLDAAVGAQLHEAPLAEKLRLAEIKIIGLENEVEDLRRENTKLREQLAAAQKVRQRPTSPAPATSSTDDDLTGASAVDDGIPAFLKIPQEQRKAAWERNPPKPAPDGSAS